MLKKIKDRLFPQAVSWPMDVPIADIEATLRVLDKTRYPFLLESTTAAKNSAEIERVNIAAHSFAKYKMWLNETKDKIEKGAQQNV